MMVGAFAVAGAGSLQENRFGGQCCGQQNPLKQMLRTLMQVLRGLTGQPGCGPQGPHGPHGHHCFNQQNPNFGHGVFAQAGVGNGGKRATAAEIFLGRPNLHGDAQDFMSLFF